MGDVWGLMKSISGLLELHFCSCKDEIYKRRTAGDLGCNVNDIRGCPTHPAAFSLDQGALQLRWKSKDSCALDLELCLWNVFLSLWVHSFILT